MSVESPTDRPKASPGLYIVATPIGNLRDITLRALDVLRSVDVILCEDTRVTSKLCAAHGIDRPLLAYHEHNARKVTPRIMDRLGAGEALALVSDAGTPLVSDPGYRLVAEAAEADVPVIPVPGPSALLAALCIAGLPTDRFLFAGFLPEKAGARANALAELADVPASLVFYESPRRLAASLATMAEGLGNRPAAICRELTKLYEEARRGTLLELAEHYGDAGAPKGEVVIVVGPPPAGDADAADVDELLRAALREVSLKDAAARVSRLTGVPRRQVYNRALEIARNADD